MGAVRGLLRWPVRKKAALAIEYYWKGRGKRCAAYLVKHILELVLRKRRALNIFHRTQIFRHTLSILLSHGLHSLLGKLIADLWVVSEIGLRTDDEAGYAGAVVVDFWEPLLAHVLE